MLFRSKGIRPVGLKLGAQHVVDNVALKLRPCKDEGVIERISWSTPSEEVSAKLFKRVRRGAKPRARRAAALREGISKLVLVLTLPDEAEVDGCLDPEQTNDVEVLLTCVAVKHTILASVPRNAVSQPANTTAGTHR